MSASLNRPKLGMVELTMMFDYNANILYVTIIQGKNLKTFGGTNIAKPDAFILGYLLPKRTMATMRKTCYVRIHHMFSRILNFLFEIVFREKSCLFDENNSSIGILQSFDS